MSGTAAFGTRAARPVESEAGSQTVWLLSEAQEGHHAGGVQGPSEGNSSPERTDCSSAGVGRLQLHFTEAPGRTDSSVPTSGGHGGTAQRGFARSVSAGSEHRLAGVQVFDVGRLKQALFGKLGHGRPGVRAAVSRPPGDRFPRMLTLTTHCAGYGSAEDAGLFEKKRVYSPGSFHSRGRAGEASLVRWTLPADSLWVARTVSVR